MRRGFDGLAALARDVLQQDPSRPPLRVWQQARGPRQNPLLGSLSFCLWYKRIRKGPLPFPRQRDRLRAARRRQVGAALGRIQLQHAVRRPASSLNLRHRLA
ncbi:IS66 family insertion sequence element accessory protein TnpB [bacterium]|nr:IS66 family insertion sequence element accessory protein TnpB [bacterium]